MTIPEHVAEPTTNVEEEHVLYCEVHPTTETTLRCNRCERLMCPKCAVQTPVGYRCKECVRTQQDTFFDAHILDYIVAAGISLVLSFIAAFFISRIGFFYIAFLISPAAGAIIGAAVRRLTNRRRGRYIGRIVGICIILGALPFLLVNFYSIGLYIYLFLATSAAVTQFRLHLSS